MRGEDGVNSRRGFLKEAGALAALFGLGLAGEKNADAHPGPGCENREQEFVRLAEGDENIRPGDIRLIADAVYSHDGAPGQSVNFLSEKIRGYKTNEVWLDPRVEKKLKMAEQYLRDLLIRKKVDAQIANNFFIIVKDGYRPHKATHHLHEFAKRHRISPADVANNISGHNNGKVVDVTLGYLLPDGSIKEVWMGAHFDEFGGLASHKYKGRDLDEQNDKKYSYRQAGYAVSSRLTALDLRNFLKEAMEKAGGNAYGREYWHYTFGGGACNDVDIE